MRGAALALVGLLLAVGCGPSEPAGWPNLVLILLDTARVDHFGFAGYPRPTSPALDRFAGESTVFLRHYAHASRTGPSVASIITGLHPQSHGVVNPLDHWGALGTLAPEQTTLAEILSANGYRCAGYVANLNVSSRFGFGQGFEDYRLLDYARAPQLLALARDWLAGAQEPFFLYLHFMESHSPYRAPEPFARAFADPRYRGPVNGSTRQLDQVVKGELHLDVADAARLEALYDQEIRSFDASFGEFLDFLEQQGLAGRTWVVFLADHGEELLDHGSVLHGFTLYEEQLRVPLLIRDPREREGRRVTVRTRHVDLLPTLLELLGVPYAGPLQGRSLAGFLGRGTPPADDAPVLAQVSLNGVRTVKLRSLVDGHWKLIQNLIPGPSFELYDLAADPGEQHDLAAERADRVAELSRRLEQWLAKLPVAPGGQTLLRPDEIERLRALGYLPE